MAGLIKKSPPSKRCFWRFEALNKELANPAGDNIDSLKRLREQLQVANSTLERVADPAKNASRMANLLATAIPSPEVHSNLSVALAETETTQMSSFKAPEADVEAVQSMAPNEKQWKQAIDEFDLQIALARLAGFNEAALGQLSKPLKDATSERMAKLTEARIQLAELLDKRPAAIASSVNANEKDRLEELAKLRNALPHWLLLEPQQRDEVNPKNSLAVKLDRASWNDLLAWNSDRFQRAADDAPVAQSPFLRGTSATFQALANADSDQPPIPQRDPPALSIESPDEVSLVTLGEAHPNHQSQISCQ